MRVRPLNLGRELREHQDWPRQRASKQFGRSSWRWVFMSGGFDSINFMSAIELAITTLLRELNDTDAGRHERACFLIERHRRTIKSASDSSFWTRSPRTLASLTADPLSAEDHLLELLRLWRNEPRTSTWFSCLFGRPEYRLPCGHILCLNCVRDFGQSTKGEKYPGVVFTRSVCCVLLSNQTINGLVESR